MGAVRRMSDEGGGRFDADTVARPGRTRPPFMPPAARGAGGGAGGRARRHRLLRPASARVTTQSWVGDGLLPLQQRGGGRPPCARSGPRRVWCWTGTSTTATGRTTSSTRPRVLFASLHQFPLYPRQRAVARRRGGEGEGYTMNLPVPPGRARKVAAPGRARRASRAPVPAELVLAVRGVRRPPGRSARGVHARRGVVARWRARRGLGERRCARGRHARGRVRPRRPAVSVAAAMEALADGSRRAPASRTRSRALRQGPWGGTGSWRSDGVTPARPPGGYNPLRSRGRCGVRVLRLVVLVVVGLLALGSIALAKGPSDSHGGHNESPNSHEPPPTEPSVPSSSSRSRRGSSASSRSRRARRRS